MVLHILYSIHPFIKKLYIIIDLNKFHKFKILDINNVIYNLFYKFGDWGLGIGDWAQSPIPNPQSPIN